jgi:PDZ domain-containing secreted protein
MKKALFTKSKMAIAFGSLFIASSLTLSAQEEQSKTVKIKVITSENGKITEIEKEIELNERSMQWIEEAMGDEGASNVKVMKFISEEGIDEEMEVLIKELKNNEDVIMDFDFDQDGPIEIEKIMKHKAKRHGNKALMGVYGESLTDEDKKGLNVKYGVKINEIVEESGAAKAGLKSGDVVLKIDEFTLVSFSNLSEVVGMYNPGDNAKIEVISGGNRVTKDLTFGENKQKEVNYEYNFDNKMSWSSHEYGSMKAFLGIVASDEKSEDGAKIGRVLDESSASAMGIKANDVLTSINGNSISNFSDIGLQLKELKPGNNVKLEVLRDGKKEKLSGELKSKAETKGTNHDVFVYKNIKHCGDKSENNEIRIAILIQELDDEDKKELKKSVGVNVSDNNLELDDFSFMPNPTNGVFKVSFTPTEEGPIELQLLDQSGKEIMKETINADGNKVVKELDITDEATGIYFLIVTQNNQSNSKKIIKK